MSFVTARNGQGIERQFTQLQWNLMGRNKGTWVQVNPQVTENTLKTGDKEKTTDTKPDDNTGTPIPENILTALKDEFTKQGAGISKSALKDYLDKKEIPYENNLKIKDLLLKVGEECKFDCKVLADNF